MLSPMPVAEPVAKVWEDAVSPFRFVMALPPTRVEVDIHAVPVPVEESICPVVPEALEESNKAPVSLMLPATDNNWAGVVVPMPAYPLWSTVTKEVPVEEEILNGNVPEEP